MRVFRRMQRRPLVAGMTVRLKGAAALHMLALSTLALGALPQSGLAQEEEASVMEEVTVTAQKRAQSLQDIPVSIQAITESTIRELGATVISDLESSAPSLQTGGIVGSSNQQMGLRGIVDYSRNTGIDARMGIYIDGIYQGRSYSSDQPLLGLERVEILRGPQGTLFGKNTVSGAISLVTRTPDEVFEGQVMGELGNFDYRKVGAYVSGPISDTVFGFLSFSYDESDGYYYNTTLGRDTGSYERWSTRGKLRFVPNDRLEIIVTGDAAQSDSNSPLLVNASLPPFTSQQNFEASDAVNFWGGALTINYDLDAGYTFTSLTSYRESDYATVYDDDITPFEIQTSNFDEDSDQLSQEFRLVSPREDRYDWVAGLYYFDSDMSTTRSACFGEDLYNLLIPALAPFAPALSGCGNIPNTVGSESWAAYVHGNYRFSDAWELTAGIRYTDESKDVYWEQFNEPNDPATAAALEAATGLPLTQAPGALFGAVNYAPIIDSRSESDWSPTIGLNWFAGADTMLYGKYARGFKSGGYNADFMTAGLDFFEYQDESVDSWEAGLKSTMLDGTLRVNVAAFMMEFDDFQVFQFLRNSRGGTTLQLTNAGKATSQGLELETNWLPTDRLEFVFNLARLDASYDLFENPVPDEPDFTGNALPYAPDWKIYLSAQYLLPLGEHGGLRFFADYSWVDDQFSDPSNDPAYLIESYSLVNARVSWQPLSERWELALWGRNLADEEYNRINSVNFLGFPRTAWGEPRTYGVSFTWFMGR
jgi:iron complex outermembrane receptor protein